MLVTLPPQHGAENRAHDHRGQQHHLRLGRPHERAQARQRDGRNRLRQARKTCFEQQAARLPGDWPAPRPPAPAGLSGSWTAPDTVRSSCGTPARDWPFRSASFPTAPESTARRGPRPRPSRPAAASRPARPGSRAGPSVPGVPRLRGQPAAWQALCVRMTSCCRRSVLAGIEFPGFSERDSASPFLPPVPWTGLPAVVLPRARRSSAGSATERSE